MTCFSCGVVLGPKECCNPDFATRHLTTCQRSREPVPEASGQLLPLRLLPYALLQVAMLASTGVILFFNCESQAQTIYSTLIIHIGLCISIVSTVSQRGPSLSNIPRGAINLFFPLFLAKEKKTKMVYIHLTLSSLVSLAICLVTSFFHKREIHFEEDSFVLSKSHTFAIGFNIGSMFLSALLTCLIKFAAIITNMRRVF